VDSILIFCPTWTVLRAPDLTSRAFSGNLAHSLPYSETCNLWNVPERRDVPTRIDEPLPNFIERVESCVAGTAALNSSGRLS
jgi:hypothetical protein